MGLEWAGSSPLLGQGAAGEGVIWMPPPAIAFLSSFTGVQPSFLAWALLLRFSACSKIKHMQVFFSLVFSSDEVAFSEVRSLVSAPAKDPAQWCGNRDKALRYLAERSGERTRGLHSQHRTSKSLQGKQGSQGRSKESDYWV